jgi:DNA-binding MarR family transcriptional regulator
MMAENIKGAPAKAAPPIKIPAVFQKRKTVGKDAYRGKVSVSQYIYSIVNLNLLETFGAPPRNVLSVFSYIIYQLNSPSEKFGFWHNDRRWVNKTYEEISKELIISKSTVERAIYKLEDLGVILSTRGAHSRKSYTINLDKIKELYPEALNDPALQRYDSLVKMFRIKMMSQEPQNDVNIIEEDNTPHKKDIYMSSQEAERKKEAVQEDSPSPPPPTLEPLAPEVKLKMLNIWNNEVQTERLTGFKNPLKPYPGTLKILAKALNDHFKGDIEEWKHYCRLVGSSENCLGKNAKGWVATLLWCLKESTIENIYNGEYGVKDIPKLLLVPTVKAVPENTEVPMSPFEIEYRDKAILLLGKPTYISWVNPMAIELVNLGQEGNILRITAPTRFMKNWLKTHYESVLLEIGRSITNVREINFYDRG